MPERFINANAFGALLADPLSRTSVLEVLQTGEFFRHRGDGQIAWSDRLEHDFAAWHGHTLDHSAIATSSGTVALTVALQALGVSAGDRVLVPAYTFIATPMAVVAVGAVPEPFDIQPDFGVDVGDLEARLHSGIKAAIVVHIQGHAADLASAARLLADRGIPLIEDACQGFGATCHGIQTGTTGTVSCFSFQQSKQLASGEGGMVLAADPADAALCRKLVDLGAVRDDQGRPTWDDPTAVFGQNLRMTELQAALLVPQLASASDVIREQKERRGLLRRIVEARGVVTFRSRDPDGDTGSHLLVEMSDGAAAEAMIRTASARSVLVRRIWEKPYYHYRLFQRAGMSPSQLGVPPAGTAERLAPRLLSVPVPPTLGTDELDVVAEAIVAGVARHQDTVPQ